MLLPPRTWVPASRAFISRSILELPNPGYARVRRRHQGRGGTRTRALPADGNGRPNNSRARGSASRGSSSARRSVSRSSSASSARTRRTCARSRAKSSGGGVEPQGARRPARLERPRRTLKVDLDQDKARALGLAPADVALVTQTVMNGATLSQLREHEDLIDIVARAVPAERLNLDTLKDVNLYTRQGTVVPLSQVARVSYELEEPVLWRRNRDMAITVRADVKDGEQGVSVTQEIVPHLKDIRGEAAARLSHRRRRRGRGKRQGERGADSGVPGDGGHDPDDADAAAAELLPDVMVLLTAPLGLIGVVAALLVFHAPLGFVAILGIIALCGMIMRNSVILVDQVAARDGAGPRSVERHARCRRASDAPGRADRGRHDARDDPAHAQRVLGADGDRDHGRADRRDAADDLLRAGALRGVVQGRAGFCSESPMPSAAPAPA